MISNKMFVDLNPFFICSSKTSFLYVVSFKCYPNLNTELQGLLENRRWFKKTFTFKRAEQKKFFNQICWKKSFHCICHGCCYSRHVTCAFRVNTNRMSCCWIRQKKNWMLLTNFKCSNICFQILFYLVYLFLCVVINTRAKPKRKSNEPAFWAVKWSIYGMFLTAKHINLVLVHAVPRWLTHKPSIIFNINILLLDSFGLFCIFWLKYRKRFVGEQKEDPRDE